MNNATRPVILLFFAALACAAAPSGQELYEKRCSTCHEQRNPRVPYREALQAMPSARIVRALETGVMMAVGFTLTQEEKSAVATYLGTTAPVSGPPPSAYCADRTVKLPASPQTSWNGWSPGTSNARFQSADAARLTLDQVHRLKLKWAFGLDGDVSAFAPPTVIDGQVFVGSAGGVIHAMRAETGCIQWTFQAGSSVRSAIVVAREANRNILLFGDMTGWFYALAAETGAQLWKAHIETHDSTRLTAAPLVYKGVVYVPVSSWEETRSSDADYPCCTFRGSVVALRIRDGMELWKTYMTDAPKPTGKNARGVQQFGPSGAGIWSTPTLDSKRGVLYVTTGDNYSLPDTDTSDSIRALSLSTGHIVWSKQITQRDVYNSSCSGNRANCPAEPGPDYDFGSSAILVTTSAGRELLLAGQKSGIVFALDPAKKGEIVWQTRVGRGGVNGGVQWGMATDGRQVYASVSDVLRSAQTDPFDTRRAKVDPREGGGLTALRVADGSQIWHAAPVPCPANAASGCSPAQPGAVTGIPGVVFATSMDGHLRAHSAEDGRVLWDFDTARDFTTVNGVKAHGGSIDGPGAVVVNGMVFITSGYPRNGGIPGNVLLAFSADGE
jgi:polyvinyl alcohol dehydrogenase (cytochrome)